ncbi:hypothetical protein LTR05_000196 [Lithohypha guttulata]|uniref:Uncharacterized protein n=1 Tax=Lithohypha guttulata TaxID=1690604 RepID=A0AAN7Y968_9EURO|nr:hypothetical protein LTR05_000196 [Lithohypha guttulata]
MPTGTELWLPKKISGDNVQFMKARTASNQVKDTIDLKCCMHGLIPICVSDDSSACGLAEKALEVRQEENLCCYRVLETFDCYVCEKATAVDGAIQARAQNEDGDCCILWPGRYFSCAAGICPKGFTSTTITLPHPAAATAAVGARTLSNINLEAEKAVAAATFETVVEECHCIWFGVFVCTGCGKVDVTNTAIEAPTPVGVARRQQTYDFHLTCNGRYDVVAGKHQCKSSLIAGDACLSSCSCDGAG